MQSITSTTHSAGALLFVRSVADLPRAIRDVNELLSRRRAPGRPGEDVLGIVVRGGVGAQRLSSESGSVVLRESIALCGFWDLCWFDHSLAGGRSDAEHRRKILLDSLLIGRQMELAGAEAKTLVLPVFTFWEAREAVDARVDHLKVHHPMLAISSDCFVHDPERRGIVSLEGYGRTEDRYRPIERWQ